MKVMVYKEDSLQRLKELLDKYAVEYFAKHYKYGGFLYEDFEHNFMLPYTSKEVISSSFFGVFKKYEYIIHTKELLQEYIFGDSDYYGRRDLETIRDIVRGVHVVNKLGGELELSIREFSVIRDIIIHADN